jgi:malate synthase
MAGLLSLALQVLRPATRDRHGPSPSRAADDHADFRSRYRDHRPYYAEYAQILTPEAVALAAKLQRAFGDRRSKLLARRAQRQAEIDAGKLPDFCTRRARSAMATGAARRFHPTFSTAAWRSRARRPQDDRQRAQFRRVGVHGRFRGRQYADVGQQLAGPLNLRDAVGAASISPAPEGKRYELDDKTRVLFVRPRGWHLPEKHVLIDGQPIRGGSSTSALFLPQRKELLAAARPVFLPAQAREPSRGALWNDVFVLAQDELGVPRGTIRPRC